MPRGQGIYDNTDEPDENTRREKVSTSGDVDIERDTPDVMTTDEDAEPTS